MGSRRIAGGVVWGNPDEMRRQWAMALSYCILPSMLLGRLTLFVRQRSGTDFTSVDTSAGAQVVIVGAIVLMLAFAHRTPFLLRKLSGTSVGFLMLFYAFCAVSALWSPAKAYSLYRAVEVMAVCLAVFAALDCLNDFERAERLALGMAITTIALIFVGDVRLSGWGSLHSNHGPAAAAMTLCYCLGEVGRAVGLRRRVLQVSALVSGAALCAGTCASANVAALCGVLVIGIVGRGKARMLLAFLFAVVVLLTLTGCVSRLEDAALAILFPGKNWDQVQSGTGRVNLWEMCWALIQERPLLGYGFAAAARSSLQVMSAHNSYVDILLAEGIVGLILFGLSGAVLLRELWQMPSVACGYVGGCAMFTATMVVCIGVAVLGNDLHPPMFPYVGFAGLYVLHVLPRHDGTRDSPASLQGSGSGWGKPYLVQ
jgi:O-antigen ligase